MAMGSPMESVLPIKCNLHIILQYNFYVKLIFSNILKIQHKINKDFE